MTDDAITNQPVVIDNGTGMLKAGFAGVDHPKVLFPAFVGHRKPWYPRVMAGGLEGDSFVGKKADEYRGLLRLRYPVEHGIVKDWSGMEAIWNYTYNELRCSPEEHPVLLTEAPLNPTKNREKAAELFFETFNVPALFISIQAVLSLYASGRTTGVVLDSGDGVTHAVPIYEGFAMPHAIQRIDLAGRDITEHLQLLLRKGGHYLYTSAEKEVVRSIKESLCYIAYDPSKEEEALDTDKTSKVGAQKFKLPDGNVIEVGAERFRAPEILFHPELVGEEFGGIQDCLSSSILRCDVDLRKTLYSTIILAGGSTLFPGFGDRLLNELKNLSPKDIKIKINAPPERKYSTWMGGSILASLTTFKKMWVSAEEYEEDGANIVHRKMF